MRVWRLASLTAVLAAGFLGVVPAWLGSAWAAPQRSLGPGCAPQRPAVAYYAGAIAAARQRGKAPIPCVTRTGYATSEVSVAVTNDGAILFNPAIAASGTQGMIRSVDKGRSWQFVPHAANGAPVTSAIDQNLWVDRPTGRAFWVKIDDFPAPTPPRFDFSDDAGQSWTAAAQPCPNRAYGPLGCGHPQVFSGPPTKSMRHLQQGFPDAVYVCGGGANPLACQKSLDGGKTWGAPVTIPTPAGVSCTGFTNFGLNGVVDRDGTVYVPFTPCQRPYVAISHDEGATWKTVLVANTDTLGFGELPLGIDKAGNLYAAWAGDADRLPHLSISRDHGTHWSSPLMVAPPGVKEVAIPQLVAGATGQVAVSFYGSTNAPGPPFPASCSSFSLACPAYNNETWNTYATETFDALRARPLFWSATLNNPADPTWLGCSPSATGVVTAPGSTGGCSALSDSTAESTEGGRVDYFGTTMSPGDTPWVGFVQECPNGQPLPGNPNCPATLTGNPDDALYGLVGRLVRPHRHRGRSHTKNTLARLDRPGTHRPPDGSPRLRQRWGISTRASS
jgi:hypothetical protein